VHKDIKKILTDSFGCKVYFENDASLVGLGEAMHGAGKGNAIVVYITVSTGVGGTRIVDGCIDLSRHGFEIGHHHVRDGKTLEELVSGTVIAEKYGRHPKEILDKDIWEQYTDDLALGVSNAVLFWSPDIVVIGGSMARSVLFDRLNQKLKEDTQIFEKLPTVVHAALDTVGGLYGGLAYCQNLDRQKKSL
jgi:predicted NBD/HSP70 family sugar kinase